MSHTDPAPLCFAVTCNHLSLKSWQIECIHNLLASKQVKLTEFINSTNKTESKTGFKNFLYHFYLNKLVRPLSFKKVSIKKSFKDIPIIELESQVFNQTDFVLHFDETVSFSPAGFNTRYGTWFFGNDNDHLNYRSSPCFWEVFKEDASTGISLIIEKDNDLFVYKKGFFKTALHSVTKNMDSVYWGCSSLAVGTTKEIQNGLFKNKESILKSRPVQYPLPGNTAMLFFFFRLLKNKIIKTFTNLFFAEKWNIGIVQAPVWSFLNKSFVPAIKWMKEPGGTDFYADPFVIKSGANLKLFFENFDTKKNKGIISVKDLSDFEAGNNFETALDTDIHLSYPYLLNHDEKTYCIPETYQFNEVSLYYLENNRLIKDCVLIKDFEGLDNTVVHFQNKWWMFSACKKNKGADLHLFIFFADDLKGPWHPHARNPVKTDIRSARPGGLPLIYNGNLYRPAQDSSKSYGGRIVINKVLKLSTTEFEEEPVNFLEPDKNSIYKDGLHTLCGVDNITIIDGKRYVLTWNNILKLLKR